MISLPHDIFGLMAVVFALGLQHGMDPDHVATIDGLTRHNASLRPRLAPWSGTLFSLGHGVVVTLAAALIATFSHDWAPPAWLEVFGSWFSILFLLALGVLNLCAAFRSPGPASVSMVGIRSRCLGRFTTSSHPLVITAVGAAFAISFDTVSQTALFSLSAANVAGWVFAGVLGVIFMLGMMCADGLAGWWLGGLLRRADAGNRGHGMRALSRAMSLLVGGMSVVIGALGVARWLYPQATAGIDRFAWLLGGAMAIVVPLLCSYLLRRQGRLAA